MSEVGRDPFLAAAELGGLDVVQPEANQLLCDIDSTEDEAFLLGQLELLDNAELEVSVEKITTSKSGNKHYYLRTPNPLTPGERILLQACLGSDRKRELLSYVAVVKKKPYPPTVLYEVPRQQAAAVANQTFMC